MVDTIIGGRMKGNRQSQVGYKEVAVSHAQKRKKFRQKAHLLAGTKSEQVPLNCVGMLWLND